MVNCHALVLILCLADCFTFPSFNLPSPTCSVEMDFSGAVETNVVNHSWKTIHIFESFTAILKDLISCQFHQIQSMPHVWYQYIINLVTYCIFSNLVGIITIISCTSTSNIPIDEHIYAPRCTSIWINICHCNLSHSQRSRSLCSFFANVQLTLKKMELQWIRRVGWTDDA